MLATTSGDSVTFHTMANAAAPLLVHGKYDLTVSSSSQIESSIVCTVEKVAKNLLQIMFATTSGDSVTFHTMANAAAPLLLVHGKYDLTVCSSQ